MDPKKNTPYTPTALGIQEGIVGIAMGKLACAILGGYQVTLEHAEATALYSAMQGMYKAAKTTWAAEEPSAFPQRQTGGGVAHSQAEADLMLQQHALIANPTGDDDTGGF